MMFYIYFIINAFLAGKYYGDDFYADRKFLKHGKILAPLGICFLMLFGTFVPVLSAVFSLIRKAVTFIDSYINFRFWYYWNFTKKYQNLEEDYLKRLKEMQISAGKTGTFRSKMFVRGIQKVLNHPSNLKTKSEEPSFTEYMDSGQFEKMNAVVNRLFKEEKLGLNFAHIPAEKIPFDVSLLRDGDVITNEHGEHVSYWEQGYYSILTNNASDFIKHPNSIWEHKNIFE